MDEKTPNQLVAENLRRARELRRWTQKETVERLAEYGLNWTAPALSVAEHTVDPAAKRIREFSADDVLVFARVFELPVVWFFLPPDSRVGIRAHPDSRRISVGELLELLYGAEHPEMLTRVEALIHQLPAKVGRPLYRKLKDRRTGRLVEAALQLVLQRFDGLTDDVGRLHTALQEARRGIRRDLTEEGTGVLEPALEGVPLKELGRVVPQREWEEAKKAILKLSQAGVPTGEIGRVVLEGEWEEAKKR